VQPTVLSKTLCAERNWSGKVLSVAAVTVAGSAPGENLPISRTASSDALPHIPHDEVV